MTSDPIFEPGRLGTLPLPNRLIVAPMTRISAAPDGTPTAQMADYYAEYARGGFGLIITEGTYPDTAYSQCYVNQPGLATDAQAQGWRPVVEAVHQAGGRIAAQLMHGGALTMHNRFASGTVAPSAVQPAGEQPPRYHGKGPYPTPRELNAAEIPDIIAGFAAAAARAVTAGFDAVEIHGANGYLIDQFLSHHTNLRTDDWGGTLTNRLRLAVEVAHAVVAAVPAHVPVGIRISQTKVNDLSHVWPGGADDAATIFSALDATGISYIHVSSHLGCGPVFGTGLSLAGLARRHAGCKIIANGKLEDTATARALLNRGEADFLSLAKAALADPQWPSKVAAGQSPVPFDPGILSPDGSLASAAAFRAALGR
jgi:2,4-dienoyl-CoA reductase-like NADH-dependent reductase (Old Yellow Enzyme family)